ncbi:SpoIIE family protein phosphatase [Thermospira aquatica]|uniref:SpoIIE family protein phosphatase n=1 Tax=Thermospira aquatica TaxID=2828656 RepID=A0AAX3BDL1_9SPIR|nr:SpoIIE family protein phosphatase [Thermospira aquatica]URA10408.1 SpoIIE family protein phosphatase [Thermospira aquatica]
MKLLEKDPEKRYQNASGLLYDLHTLYQAFQQGKQLSAFTPGTKDFSPEIRFSRSWYGRENAKNELSEIIRRAILGSLQNVVLIGEKGIGKTLLINTVTNEFQNREMWHIRLTFSEERKTTSYHGIRQFLYDTVQQMYLLPFSEQKRIKDAWEGKLKKQGKVLTSFFPEMEKLFPADEEVETLDQEATQKRLFYLFSEFVALLVSKKHPMVLVLDHIQWADKESQKLFAHLCRQNLSYVCIITVFQGNEADWQNFSGLLEDVTYRTLVLQPWEESHLTHYLSSLLQQPETSVQSLAHLLFEKTEGNPAQLEKLLEKLRETDLLFLDGYKGWKWNEQEIAGFQLQDENTGLEKLLSSLDEDTRRTLVIACVLGNRFPMSLFEEIIGISEEETVSILFPLFDKRLLSIKDNMIYWNHPSTREGLYHSLQENEKSSAHALVANYFFQQPFENYADKLYYVFDHVIKGLSQFSTEKERERVLFLTHKVIEQNKQSGAFTAIYEVLSLILSEFSLDTKSEFFLPLYEAYAESAYYTANYETLEKLLLFLKEKGYDEMVCFDLWILLMKALGSEEQYEKATALFYNLVSLLSLPLPKHVSLTRALPLLLEMLWRMQNLSETQIRNLPQNTHPLIEKQAKLLFSFSPFAFFSSPLLNVFINLLGTKLSLRYGLVSQTPFFFISCGIITAGLGNKKLGNTLADKGLYLIEKMDYNTNAPENYFIYYSFLYFWVHPQHEIPERLSKVYDATIAKGDTEFAAYALMVMNLHFWQIHSLLPIAREYMRQNVQTIHGLGQKSQEIVSRLCLQLVDNLIQPSEDPTLLEGEWYQESIQRPIHEKEHDFFALRYLILYKIILSYLFEKYEIAYRLVPSLPHFDPASQSSPAYFLFQLFRGLTAARLFSNSVGKSKKQEFSRLLREAIQNYGKWARLSEQNFSAGLFLLKAELARITRKNWQAIHFYGKAIESARTHNYRLYEALGFELRAKFWESQGEKLLADQDMTQSLRLYKLWGAESKVKALLQSYPHLFPHLGKKDDTTTTLHTLTSTGTQTLDLLTIIKASEALITTTDVNTLLSRILIMTMENAGAEKGVFLYEKEDSLLVRAVKTPDQEAQVFSLDFQEYTDIPQRVIQYALQKNEEILIEDAQEEALLVKDPYITRNLVRSILIIPIYRTGKRVGLVYLENNMGRGMFTAESISTLKILLAQASLALQNIELLDRIKDTARLETEMNLAKDLQTGLLPKHPSLPGYEVLGYMQTASEVGGDYYDIIGETKPSWVIIGDVSGHGFPSGQIMAMTQTALQTLIRENPLRLPSELLRIANQTITYNIGNIFAEEFKYVTITALRLEEDGSILHSGLHQDIWIYRASSQQVETIITDGLWLGVENLMGRSEEDKSFTLHEGDVMLLYTDGLTEARENGELIDEKPKTILQAYGHEPLSTIKEQLEKLIAQCEIRDDVTFVLVKKTSP